MSERGYPSCGAKGAGAEVVPDVVGEVAGLDRPVDEPVDVFQVETGQHDLLRGPNGVKVLQAPLDVDGARPTGCRPPAGAWCAGMRAC